MALYAIEAIAMLVSGLFMLFQVVYPLINGDPLFPAFRKKKVEVEKKLTIAEEEVEIAAIEKETAEAESVAAKIRESIKGEEDAK